MTPTDLRAFVRIRLAHTLRVVPPPIQSIRLLSRNEPSCVGVLIGFTSVCSKSGPPLNGLLQLATASGVLNPDSTGSESSGLRRLRSAELWAVNFSVPQTLVVNRHCQLAEERFLLVVALMQAERTPIALSDAMWGRPRSLHISSGSCAIYRRSRHLDASPAGRFAITAKTRAEKREQPLRNQSNTTFDNPRAVSTSSLFGATMFHAVNPTHFPL
uniref:Uncharacterized protein n=1 Tax=Mycena chlorophos TaxID=658473 RepID=A0ABQ0M272_MYCCL|nr:predicted protein [Mycena chlorophos]